MKRIMIVGCIGSGKTTFSKKLSKKIGVEIIHLDDFFFDKKNKIKGKKEWEEVVTALSQKENWIMDGNYPGTFDIRLKRVDTIFFLNISRLQCIYNVFTRGIKKYFHGASNELPPISNNFKINIYQRILKYNKGRRQRHIRALMSNTKNIDINIFNSYNEINNYLSKL